MNDVIQTIMERRSVRRYQEKQIPREDCGLIVDAGLAAPSGMNRQAVHITVVRNKEMIDRITRELKAAVARMPQNRYREYVGAAAYTVNFGAPTFIIVAANMAAAGTPVQDCSCVLENMFLAARSLNIGSCWVNQLGSVTEDSAFQAFLQNDLRFPPDHEIIGSAAFGYPAGEFPAAPIRRGTADWVE